MKDVGYFITVVIVVRMDDGRGTAVKKNNATGETLMTWCFD
jgi:hypothetical protein